MGLSKLIWAEDAASVGMVISQGAQQNDQTDFTRVQHLSFYTRQKDVGEGYMTCMQCCRPLALHSYKLCVVCRLTVNLEGQAAQECGGIVVNRVNPRVFFDNLEFRYAVISSC